MILRSFSWHKLECCAELLFAFSCLAVLVIFCPLRLAGVQSRRRRREEVRWVRMVIADPTVSLDLTSELYIAGEDHFFTLGILSDVPSVSLSFLGHKFTVLNAQSSQSLVS